jgi:hypothetical protein
MEENMKRISSFFIGLLLLGNFANAQQNYYCDPCNPCGYAPENMEFAVYADYLYWKVCRPDIVIFDSFDDATIINPNYDSGWRIGGMIKRCNWDIGAKYTSFNTSTRIEQLFANGNDFFNPFIDYSTDWDIVDIEVGYTFSFDCSSASFRPFIGAKLAWIDDKIEAEIQFDSISEGIRSEIDFKGYGLYAGMEGKYLLYQAQMCDACIPFYFVGRGSVGVLHSDVTRNVAFFIGTITDEAFEIRDRCLYVPVIEVFAGLEIGGVEWGCVTPYVMLGYEAQSWLGAGFDELGAAQIGIGGLVARFGLGF